MDGRRIDHSTTLMQLKAEWEDIRRRRELVDAQFDRQQRLIPDTIESLVEREGRAEGAQRYRLTAAEMVGLAFSGGGVRSATVNLGILQGLERYGLLRHVDYLSTVSGGGFIGSSLSSLMATPVAADGSRGGFPFRIDEGGVEAPALEHLRDHSNYAATNGFIDYARVTGVLISGILTNALILVPAPAVLAVVVAVVYGDFLRDWSAAPGSYNSIDVFLVTPWVAAVALAFCLFASALSRAFGQPGRKLPKRRGRLLARRDTLERALGLGLVVTSVVAAVESLPLALAWFHHAVADGGDSVASITSALTGTGAVAGSLLGSKLATSPGIKRLAGLSFAAVLGMLVPAVVFFVCADLFVYSLQAGAGWAMVDPTLYPPMVWIVLVSWVMFAGLIDVNFSGLHNYSRDRLSGAFLLTCDKRGGVNSNDDLRLSELSPPGSLAPVHIINAALNRQASKDLGLRGRSCDFFSFTKYFIGSPSTGYCTTGLMESVFPNMTLGTAMAISGAAASPNMGTFTTRPAVMLMTLLNIRQGVWLPNPKQLNARFSGRAADERGMVSRLLDIRRYQPDARALVREMFSRLDTHGTLVNVSDGGHIENTAGYELLRRRCKYVIVSDASEDAAMTHSGLATLMLFARVDLGIEIDMDLDNFQRDGKGHSRRHAALGVIHYPETVEFAAETGYLLYFKSSLTGDEDAVMNEYRERHPSFPHQSTGDQMFDESQFEVYRALGAHMVDSIVHTDVGDGMSFAEFGQWVQGLRVHLARKVENRFQAADLSQLAGSGETRPERIQALERAAFQLAQMAQMFDELELDDPGNRTNPHNLGWMNRFRRWAATPELREVYARSCSGWSEVFQVFCEEALGLRVTVAWAMAEIQDSEAIRSLLPSGVRRQLALARSREPDFADSLFLVGKLECEGVDDDCLPDVCAARILFDGQTGRAVLRESGLSDGYDGVYLYEKAYRGLKQDLPRLLAEQQSDDRASLMLAFSDSLDDPGEASAAVGEGAIQFDFSGLPQRTLDLLGQRPERVEPSQPGKK